ncbi:MAG: hypothetical protein KF795_26510 [Labilithrix sp.]|nr:hypothetical protein [Labilithrix sp.]
MVPAAAILLGACSGADLPIASNEAPADAAADVTSPSPIDTSDGGRTPTERDAEADADAAAPRAPCPPGTSRSGSTCAPCAPGTFSAIAEASSCAPWSTCQAGSFVETPGTSTSDRVCAGCASGSFASGSDASSCAPWSTCQAGTFVETEPSATNDRSCQGCAPGTYTNAPNLSACLPAGSCAAGTVRTGASTPMTPTVCAACAAGTFCAGGTAAAVDCGGETWDGDADAATPCVAKTECLAGSRVTSAGSATTDRTCEPCVGGYSTTTNAATCTAYTSCVPGQRVSRAPTASLDRQCTACTVGTFSATTDAASCAPHTTCSPGTYVSAAGSTQSDRVCSTCSPGTTTTADNQASCVWNATPPEPGPTGCAVLARRDRTISGRATDEYDWSDRTCRSRTAALVRVDRKGGHALEFTYPLDVGRRTAGISAESSTRPGGETIVVGGFGYVVSHLQNAQIATRNGWNDSPLGSPLCKSDTSPASTYDSPACTTGWARPFTGRHHAIHEFSLNYPRWGRAGGADVRYDVPVTIHWFFHTGMDATVYAITFDLSSAPANAIVADVRAPYGSMNFDGVAAGTWGGTIGGVGWADRKKFETLAAGAMTMNSPWTWTADNSGPAYNFLWTNTSDAEMGSVATHVIGRMDAGGYDHGATGRGLSSAGGAGCASDSSYDNLAHTMPCASNWSFQSVNYAFWNASGNPALNAATSSKRLAWGADWGYLGRSTFTNVNGNTIAGHPRVSYSVFVVLDAHSKAPVKGLASQVEVIAATTLTATVGAVRTSGAAGVGRTDTMSYSPIGYSPVYSTWELDAAGNAASVGIDVNAPGLLDRPTFVVHGYTAATPPATVTLDGTTLTADQSYFASVNTAAQELWITLNSRLSGTGHRLTVN